MEPEARKINILPSFVLKVVALLTMALDHIGFMMLEYSVATQVADIFRIIGRLALPLFAFCIAEGVIHTRSFGKYIFRMGIIGTLVLIAQIVMKYGMNFEIYQGNIFIDLILGALAVKALMDKRVWIKVLAIFPLLIGIASFFMFAMDRTYTFTQFFPYYLRTQYDFFAIALIIGFYLSYPLAKSMLKIIGLQPDLYQGTNIERMTINCFSVAFLIIIATLYWGIGFFLMSNNTPFEVYWNIDAQNYCMIAGAFILLYSGKRGYNASWFQYGSYVFYPLHLVLIYLVFYIIFM